jgi:hypothetical protein
MCRKTEHPFVRMTAAEISAAFGKQNSTTAAACSQKLRVLQKEHNDLIGKTAVVVVLKVCFSDTQSSLCSDASTANTNTLPSHLCCNCKLAMLTLINSIIDASTSCCMLTAC